MLLDVLSSVCLIILLILELCIIRLRPLESVVLIVKKANYI